MPLQTRDFENEFSIKRIKNQTGTAEGTTLPPPLKAGIRVPYVQNLRIISSQNYSAGTQFTVVWDSPEFDPTVQISHFTVYVKSINSGQSEVSQNPVTVKRSPAIIKVDSSSATRAIITVQTCLKNGQTSDVNVSPTVVGKVIAPELAPTDIPESTLQDLNVVFGYSNLTGSGGITFVSSAGTITDNPSNLYWDNSTTSLGVLTNAPKSNIDNVGSLAPGNISTQINDFNAGNVLIYVCDCTSNNITVTLPTASNVPRRWYIFRKEDSSTNVVTIGSWELNTEKQCIIIYSDGTNWNLLMSGFGG